MKNKKYIIGVITGFILGIGFSVFAGTLLTASDVSYTSEGTEIKTAKDALDELFSKIKSGNATSTQILNGKTAITNIGKITGTMPNQGSWINVPTEKGKIMIPEGYHDGTGYVDLNNISSKSNYTGNGLLFAGADYTNRSGSQTIKLSKGEHYAIIITSVGRTTFLDSYNNVTFTSVNNNHTVNEVLPFTFSTGSGTTHPEGLGYKIYEINNPIEQEITINWSGGDGNYGSGLVASVIWI